MTAVQVQGETNQQAPSADARAEEFDEILYHITHDVRSALRALKSLPGWLREDLTENGSSPSTSVLEILGMIETQADRADQILVDLRTYSRIGRKSDEASMIPLREAVEGAIERAGIPDGFRVITDMGTGAVRAARNEFRELFTALLTNAVVHHDRKTGTITVRAVPADGGIRITVEDDGPGIPEQFRERVFAMMATLRARDECPGSGLGLSIARKIVRRLGGTIRAEAPLGERGARIVIQLPAGIAALPAAHPE